MKTQIVVPDVTPVSLEGKEVFVIQFRLGYNAWKKYPGSKFVPKGTGQKHKKTDNENPGTPFLSSTEKMSILQYGEHIRKNYNLVKAFHEWLPEEDCFLVQFTFSKNGALPASRGSVSYDFAFNQFLVHSYWRTRAFVNIGEKGQEMVVINCHLPVHRFDSNGNNVVEWKKDENGHKVGEWAEPIAPSCSLKVVDNHICLV